LALFASTAAAAQAPPAQAPSAQPPAGGKIIKDPAEYSAYMKALSLPDPAAKAVAFEAFLSAYPNSIMVSDALGQAMAAYQAAGDVAKVEATARRLLVLQPGDLRALAIKAFISRAAASKGDAASLAEMRSLAERGLRQAAIPNKPDGMSDADYAALRVQTSAIFYGARGFGLLNANRFSEARDSYLKALEAGSNDATDYYQLGIAALQIEPMDANGFWYVARAVNLVRAQKNEVGAIAIMTFGQRKYQSYHGGSDGWDAIRSRAGVSGPIPANFAAGIVRGATPAEIAVQAVHDNDPGTLSFSDWEYVLSYRDSSPANAAAAAKVWAAILGKEKGGALMLAIPVVVVASATPAAFEASITDENIRSHVADLNIFLAEALRTLPAPGSSITATGTITSYQLHPFRFVMTNARLAPSTTGDPSR
jgi:tetratricopeptide (TPR) repeat protein